MVDEICKRWKGPIVIALFVDMIYKNANFHTNCQNVRMFILLGDTSNPDSYPINKVFIFFKN